MTSSFTITGILRHGATVHGRSECVTWLGDRGAHVSYAEIARNAERLAAALAALGIGAGDRVGTFCWNNQAHLEAYYAVPCMGAVLHTINIRLPAAQVAHIVDNHAEDRVVIVDGTLLPLFAAGAAAAHRSPSRRSSWSVGRTPRSCWRYPRAALLRNSLA